MARVNIARTTPTVWDASASPAPRLQSGRNATSQGIANQAEHHRKNTFQNEYRRMLKKYDFQYDERYVWD